MPQMVQVRMPRWVVTLMLPGLFVCSLLALREYGIVGDPQALALAVLAAMGCALIAGGLIWANYDCYASRPSGRLNGSR